MTQTTTDTLTPKIVHEDDSIIVLLKPPGMPSVRVANSEKVSLADWLVETRPECKDASPDSPEDSGICHRLDTETSGLILGAKNPDVYKEIRKMFSENNITKQYVALVEGKPGGDPHLKSYLFNRHRGSKKVSTASLEREAPPRSRVGELKWEIIEYYEENNCSLLRVDLITGLRHQIRAQLSAIGAPLIGDTIYGSEKKLSDYQSVIKESSRETKRDFYLHSERLAFSHPVSKEEVEFFG